MGGHRKIYYSYWKIYFKSLCIACLAGCWLLVCVCVCMCAVCTLCPLFRISLAVKGKVMWCVNCCDNTKNISVSTFVCLVFATSMNEWMNVWMDERLGKVLNVCSRHKANFHCFDCNFIWHFKTRVWIVWRAWVVKMWHWFGVDNLLWTRTHTMRLIIYHSGWALNAYGLHEMVTFDDSIRQIVFNIIRIYNPFHCRSY